MRIGRQLVSGAMPASGQGRWWSMVSGVMRKTAALAAPHCGLAEVVGVYGLRAAVRFDGVIDLGKWKTLSWPRRPCRQLFTKPSSEPAWMVSEHLFVDAVGGRAQVGWANRLASPLRQPPR